MLMVSGQHHDEENRKFLRHVQTVNETLKLIFQRFFTRGACRSTQIDIQHAYVMDRCLLSMEMCNCNCILQSTKESSKISIFIANIIERAKTLSLFSSHGQWKLRDFFFVLFRFQPFLSLFNPSSSMCAVKRLIWKCAIAHWNHVVRSIVASLILYSLMETQRRSSFYHFIWDQITKAFKDFNKFQ